MTPITGGVVVHADARALARDGALHLARMATQAVRERGRFAVCLTGGSSPVDLYRQLADDAISTTIPWDAVHLFWGDERAVPPGHPRSNSGLAHHLFIDRVPIPPENVHRMRGELGGVRAAAAYREELDRFFDGRIRFDLVHLGLGADGHVASLFPFDLPRLLEREKSAVPALLASLGEWRITLTYPVLNAARRVEFLIPSDEKATVTRVAMRGPIDPHRIPAQGIAPAEGELVWRMTTTLDRAVQHSTSGA